MCVVKEMECSRCHYSSADIPAFAAVTVEIRPGGVEITESTTLTLCKHCLALEKQTQNPGKFSHNRALNSKPYDKAEDEAITPAELTQRIDALPANIVRLERALFDMRDIRYWVEQRLLSQVMGSEGIKQVQSLGNQ